MSNSFFENMPLSIATTKEPDAFPDEIPGGLSSMTIFFVVWSSLIALLYISGYGLFLLTKSPPITYEKYS